MAAVPSGPSLDSTPHYTQVPGLCDSHAKHLALQTESNWRRIVNQSFNVEGSFKFYRNIRFLQIVLPLFRGVTIDGVWIGEWIYWPLTYHSKLSPHLQITTPLSLFSACCVISHSLAMASNSGDYSASHAQVLSSQPPMQNSTLNWQQTTDNSLYSAPANFGIFLYNHFARTTQKTQPLSCWERVFAAPFIAAEVIRLLFAYPLPWECVYRVVA
jgi:hypothetical protein